MKSKYAVAKGSPKPNRTNVAAVFDNLALRCFCSADLMFCEKAAMIVMGIHKSTERLQNELMKKKRLAEYEFGVNYFSCLCK